MTQPDMEARSPAEALIRRLAESEQLQHVDRLATVGRLAAGIIHELGTPLNVVGSYAQMIATGEVTGDEVRAPARAIEEQVKRMSRIIRQLLDFARLNVERQEPLELLALARQTVNVLGAYAWKAGITLTVESHEEGPLIVDGSAGLLQQLLVNLVSNAIQAMPAGGQIAIEVLRVRRAPVGEEAERPWICIAVRDQGQGVAAAHRERIFEPFFTTKESGISTGLGLAVCADIVREHQGWLELDTSVEQGARFVVTLPESAASSATE